jgi:hypothetical protein
MREVVGNDALNLDILMPVRGNVAGAGRPPLQEMHATRRIARPPACG